MDDLPHDSDGDALRRLASAGSDLSKEMEVDFAVDVPDRNAGLAFAAAAEASGFRTAVDQDSDTNEWTCYCSRNLIPSYTTIVALQHTLGVIGIPYNAVPTGWGSFGNADDR